MKKRPTEAAPNQVSRSARRLLVVTSIHPDFDKRVWRHATSVAASGWSVELVCPWDVPDCEMRDGVRFHPFPRIRSRWQRPVMVPFRVWRTMRRLVRRADVVHFHDLDLLPFMALFSGRTPAVYDVHENYADEMLVREWLPHFLRKPAYHAMRHLHPFMARAIGNIILVNDSQRSDFSWSGFNIFELRNYASRRLADSAESGVEDRPNKVIFTGGHTRANGSMFLLDIAVHAVAMEPDIRFLVPSRFPSERYRREWNSHLRSLGLEDNFELMETVPAHEMMRLLNRARIAVNPATRARRNERALNTKFFEFMAAGLPIVSSNVGYAEEVVGQSGAGVLADPDEPRDFAKAIVELSRDREKIKRLGSQGRRMFLEFYNWECQVPDLLAFYDDIASGSFNG